MSSLPTPNPLKRPWCWIFKHKFIHFWPRSDDHPIGVLCTRCGIEWWGYYPKSMKETNDTSND